MKNTNATFLTARDPITNARGSDILHILKNTTIENTERYTLWLEAFNRLTALVTEQVADRKVMDGLRAEGSVGGVYRAVKV